MNWRCGCTKSRVNTPEFIRQRFNDLKVENNKELTMLKLSKLKDRRYTGMLTSPLHTLYVKVIFEGIITEEPNVITIFWS